jgi:hypothetical protein
MNRRRKFGALITSYLIGGALLAGTAASAQAACQLHSPSGTIKHVIHLTFDNVHFRRDNPNVPSDLELQPNLLNFITQNGTLLSNHYTPLISHTSDDIITALTGVYGDRHGIPVGNSYGYFNSNGTVSFSSSFLYWSAPSGDGKPQMINENGVTAPAPWVPFTRAGCDVGAFSVANIELESVPADVNTVFGATSPEGIEANNPALTDKSDADFLGIAIHCAQGSPLCTGNNASQARPDLLPSEPGGYTGYSALFGNLHVQPVISPSGPVKDLSGNVIQTAAGNPGFPSSFDPTATQTLGYVAQMLEAGVPIIYMYIADLHDQNPSPPSGSHSYGPGEAGYIAQAAAYNQAWGQFFARLKADGIDQTNTLFIFTADENDHFAGGSPSPSNCDGVTVPCTYAIDGEINASLNRILLTNNNNTTPFSVHSDDAPTIYLNNTPAQTSATVRTFEQNLDSLTNTSPITGNTDKLSYRLADQAEMQLLHMVTTDPARTPTMTMFGDPDYFFLTSTPNNPCTVSPSCYTQAPTFNWNHGDVQQDIIHTWLAMVGPGVLNLGIDNSTFTDHTDTRPTLMSLVGLKDDYVHDGRVLAEKLALDAQPLGVQNSPQFVALATAYKSINAIVGTLGLASLDYANGAITSGAGSSTDTTYQNYLATMPNITNDRNSLASQMKTLLEGAEFSNQPISTPAANALIASANSLVSEVQTLAQNSVQTVAAVSPNAQATTVDNTVTGFAAVINGAATTTASQCGIGLPSNFPGVLLFQTTNPTTNLPTGTLNQAVDIPAGKTQTFVFAITPTAPISQDIPLVFPCGGVNNVATIHGVNTFLLTASSTALPDMIMIDATATKDGTITLANPSASGAIGSAAINIGAAGSVTFTPTVTPYGQPAQTLPLNLSICQVNASGTCINPTTPGPSTTVNVAANQTVMLGTFVQGQGTPIQFDPANNRIFVIGTTGNVAVGEASVAVKMTSSTSMAQN